MSDLASLKQWRQTFFRRERHFYTQLAPAGEELEMQSFPLQRPSSPTTPPSRRSSYSQPTSSKLKRRSMAFFNKMDVPTYPAMVEAMAIPRMASAAPMASW
ncbi:uncharacterized protein RCC_11197 [Ramularia collo-cygni]|uniref:Uncharacterized protein n=1 Tax=Ramularia collo-cygni TaxID=112498 RepID=A0A2D3VHD6_9PEZI|nr:uncharacterized protein RCC_11197 [Ramularia collo-cygni]CZT25465.1 uncharacterized protein RCC_11197 [Ramularia collo-cygni]